MVLEEFRQKGHYDEGIRIYVRSQWWKYQILRAGGDLSLALAGALTLFYCISGEHEMYFNTLPSFLSGVVIRNLAQITKRDTASSLEKLFQEEE